MARTGRPPLSIGTAGEIGYTETRDKKGRLRVHAHALYRGSAGHTQRVKRVGQSEREARDRLKVALARMQAHTEEEGIGPHTTIRALAAAWMVEPHPWRPNTREQYVRVIDNHIIPKMGGVRLSEVRASAVSRLLTQLRNGSGAGPALQAKKALSGMFRLAVVNDAMTANPALGTVSIPQPRSTVRALTRTEEDGLRDAMRSNARATALDLPDVVDFMLGTGCRIGEALAARYNVVDLAAGSWEINATVVRVKGQGLHVQPRPKTAAGWRVIVLPSFAVQMVQRRFAEERLASEVGVVFGNPQAKSLRDPSNATNDLREVLDLLGFDWVTSHVFRKTVATRLDEAGWTARQIADHLGHARPSMTLDVYMGRRVVNAEAGTVLDR